MNVNTIERPITPPEINFEQKQSNILQKQISKFAA